MYDIVTGVPNRRLDSRVALQMFLNEYVQDREYRALALNVSERGLHLQKLSERTFPLGNAIGLEFELPGTNELIWARAEPRFDAVCDDFHVSGLRFTAMARKHARLLRDFVREFRARRRIESYTLALLTGRRTAPAPRPQRALPPPVPAFLRRN